MHTGCSGPSEIESTQSWNKMIPRTTRTQAGHSLLFRGCDWGDIISRLSLDMKLSNMEVNLGVSEWVRVLWGSWHADSVEPSRAEGAEAILGRGVGGPGGQVEVDESSGMLRGSSFQKQHITLFLHPLCSRCFNTALQESCWPLARLHLSVYLQHGVFPHPHPHPHLSHAQWIIRQYEGA